MLGRVPPHSKEIETTLLGAILLERDKLEDVLEIINDPEMFYNEGHQIIFSAVKELFYRKHAVDLMTVLNHLEASGNLEAAGGAYGLTLITQSVVTSAHAISHARIIKEKYLLREVIRKCNEAISQAYDNTSDVFEIIDSLGADIDGMIEETISEDMESAEDVYNEVLERLDKARHENKEITGVPTNIPSIDKVTGGWQKCDLIILAARPSVGKTALALNFAYQAALSNVNVAFFSLEMPKWQLVQRLLSIAEGVPFSEIKKPNIMGEVNWNKVTTCPHVGNNRIFLDDKAGLNPYLLKGKLKRMIRKRRQLTGKSEDWMVIVDYLQLMRWVEKNGNREQEIAQISRTLKEIAKDLNIPVIALSQMSRDYEKGGKRKPQLSDLRESGAIEQDADTVMFLSRASDEEVKQDADLKNIGYLDILKHRSGELASIELFKDLRFQLFKDLGFKNETPRQSPAFVTDEVYNPNAGLTSVSLEDDLPF